MPLQRPFSQAIDVPSETDPIPPGLLNHPIRTAAVPAGRGVTWSMTTATFGAFVVSAGLLWRMDLAEDDLPRMPSCKTVRVLLDEGTGGLGTHQTGGGVWPSNVVPVPKKQSQSLAPVQLRLEPVDDAPLPVIPPKELPSRPEELISVRPNLLSPLAFSGQGEGLGGGLGTGIGNGVGPSHGRRRGSTWIHSVRGDEELKVPVNCLDFKDYIPPEYPQAARDGHISGDVVLEVTIDSEGKPLHWKVLEGAPLLVKATLAVFPKWHFIAPVYKGEKVGATFEARIRFTLM